MCSRSFSPQARKADGVVSAAWVRLSRNNKVLERRVGILALNVTFSGFVLAPGANSSQGSGTSFLQSVLLDG